jgi:4-hydroxyphenylpyruvate dioxygenase-like putative hemolysin
MKGRPVPDSSPTLHHVVFCVERKNQDQAAAFWQDLGFSFVEIDLPDVGLRVLLDWDRGIEIISPSEPAGPEAADVTDFLRLHGEGVYSVVVRTADVAGPISVAERHGARVDFQQHRGSESEGFQLDEARLSPFFGMPVTLLATDLS